MDLPPIFGHGNLGQKIVTRDLARQMQGPGSRDQRVGFASAGDAQVAQVASGDFLGV